jgi:hypothetical protein
MADWLQFAKEQPESITITQWAPTYYTDHYQSALEYELLRSYHHKLSVNAMSTQLPQSTTEFECNPQIN